MPSAVPVKIRQLPDWVLEAHRARAEKAGLSLEEALRRELTESALKPMKNFASKAAEFNAALKAKYGTLSDSVDLLQEEREERG